VHKLISFPAKVKNLFAKKNLFTRKISVNKRVSIISDDLEPFNELIKRADCGLCIAVLRLEIFEVDRGVF